MADTETSADARTIASPPLTPPGAPGRESAAERAAERAAPFGEAQRADAPTSETERAGTRRRETAKRRAAAASATPGDPATHAADRPRQRDEHRGEHRGEHRDPPAHDDEPGDWNDTDEYPSDDGDDVVLGDRLNSRLRRLTAITPPRTGPLDDAVQRALGDLDAEFADGGPRARAIISRRYLAVAEAITERINRQGLPRMTRLLLSRPYAYETLLLAAIERGVGRADGGDGDDGHDHDHGHQRGFEPAATAGRARTRGATTASSARTGGGRHG